MDLEQIKKNYADLSDFKLEYLAKNEINSLEPEVIVILVEEIKRRGLNLNLMQGIAAQAKELSEEEIIAFVVKNLGEIISNWDNEEELVDFINYSNP